MIARRLVVAGRVQGVGFRDAMAGAARAAGVAGWVRNRRDGTVEAFVQGGPDAVERIVVWARRGSPAARVDRVAVEPADVDPAILSFARAPTV